ncbi:MAG: hypothetical protein Q4E10_04685 [Porphyromonas sp.]|nr:hypothetical protein [Porphyromonas sp.]
MKQLRFVLASLVLLLAVGFVACDADPSKASLFTGQYEGTGSYAKIGDGELPIVGEKVTVTVAKVGDTYNFVFSNDIPELVGVEMEKGEETLVTIGTDATGSITITKDELHIIGYTTKQGSWTVNATRK